MREEKRFMNLLIMGSTYWFILYEALEMHLFKQQEIIKNMQSFDLLFFQITMYDIKIQPIYKNER